MQQGVSGLGLEAQREAVTRYVSHHGTLLAEYTEVESGRRHKNRPQLQAALEHCKKARAILVIAKLDRLSRNVAFISKLLESDVQFVCCDNPHATKTMLHMLAVFAEHEREQISERTKAALARAKARGVRLGNPRYQESIARATAARWRGHIPPEVELLLAGWRYDNNETLQAIADRLNGLNIRTPHGFRWYPSTVRAALVKKARKDGNTMGRNNEGTIITSRLPTVSNPGTSSFAVSSAGRETAQEGDDMAAIDEAQRMLDVFASVGARSFLLTKLDLLQHKIWSKSYTAADLRDTLPAIIRTAEVRKPVVVSEGNVMLAGENVIIRPSGNVTFVQLDDLSAGQLGRVTAASFAIIETSPRNYQAWIAISGAPSDKEVEKELIRRVRKAVGEFDKSASGATRLAGCTNYKVKYGPDFPTVSLTHAAPGRVLTQQELAQMGLLASPEPIKMPPTFAHPSPGNRPWPSYEICLRRAPRKKDGGPDRSKADFSWAMICCTGGHGVEETIARLRQVSERARERERSDPGYARVTVENAARCVAQNYGKSRGRA